MERTGHQQLWREMGKGIVDKEAELANTYDMPIQHVPGTGATKGAKSVIRKVAGALETNEVTIKGEQPPSLPQVPSQEGRLYPHVNVTKSEAPKTHEKKASHYALPSQERYPLDTFEQVKQAVAYFNDTYKFMPPADRHEYCEHLVKRAYDLMIYTSPLIEKYGSATYAPLEDIEVFLDSRRETLENEDHKAILDKLAAQQPCLSPTQFADCLEAFDKMASLDVYYGNGFIADAYYTTFGKTAAKEKEEAAADESIVIGNEYITRRRLAKFLQNNVGALTLRFGAEVANSLAKSPQDIFDSLPRDQKLVLMRMANQGDSPVEQGIPTV